MDQTDQTNHTDFNKAKLQKADVAFAAFIKEQHKPFMRRLGRAVRHRRLQQGISKSDFADRVTVPVSVLEKFEEGKLEPTLWALNEMANVLDVKLSWLIAMVE